MQSKKNGDSVHYALVQMCAHLPEKIKKDKAFGVLLAGWDEKYVRKIEIIAYNVLTWLYLLKLLFRFAGSSTLSYFYKGRTRYE